MTTPNFQQLGELCQHGQIKGNCMFVGCPDGCGMTRNYYGDAEPAPTDPNWPRWKAQRLAAQGGPEAALIQILTQEQEEKSAKESLQRVYEVDELRKLRAREWARKEFAAQNAGDVAATLRAQLFDAADINDITVEYLASSLLVKNSLAWMYGDPGCYKSFIALDIAASVALGCGIQWAGAPTQQGSVLYIAAEGSAGMSKRKRAWETMTGQSLNGKFKILTMAVRITEEPFLNELIAICQEIRPVLIVIDTQSRVTPGLEENGSVMSTYVDAVTALRMATGACVLTLHHTTKGTDVLRGHGSLFGAADTVLYVSKSAGAETERFAKVSTKKQKDDRDDLFWNVRMSVQHFCEPPADQEHDATQCSSLVVRSANWSEVINAQASALERVLLVIRQMAPLQSITTAQAVELTGVPVSTTRNALSTLCDQGELEKSGSGKNTSYLRPAAKIAGHSADSASFRQPG
ncbi:AAA family ATPase [Streptomyces sp. NPDC007971]|uniref:AAA family ATPase n=1 Tax=Streptomyces sp. NPDC007971 TaxID=3364799 RepID=UPI0036F03700